MDADPKVAIELRWGIEMHADNAGQYGQTAMDLMARFEIPPTPHNYLVWYSYAAKENAALLRTIDILIADGRTFTDAWCDDLYFQFFGQADDAAILSALAENMEESLAGTIAQILEASADTSQFGSALSDVKGKLNALNDAKDETKALVAALLTATQRMERRTLKLEQQLNQSSHQIQDLRNDLESVRTEALTDPLTGIGNRKAFDNYLREKAMHAMEEGSDLCLILCDIDHFKKVNDQWGHQIGDKVLELVSQCLTETAGSQAICCRYGGEEFAFIVPAQQLQQACDLADILRLALCEKCVMNRASGASVGTVTMSFGVAQFAFGEPLPSLIERADTALYAAKHNGRNQVMSEADIPKEPGNQIAVAG